MVPWPSSKSYRNRLQNFQIGQLEASQLHRDGLMGGILVNPCWPGHLEKRPWGKISTRGTLSFAKLCQCVQPVKNDRGSVPAQQAFDNETEG
jgi:hypothetical protein